MSVSELDTIDLVGRREDELVLTVSDPLPFDEDNNHLDLLQAKLNCYLAYIESDELEKQFPESVELDIAIEIVFRHPPPEWAEDFLVYATGTLDDKGIFLRWIVAPHKAGPRGQRPVA